MKFSWFQWPGAFTWWLFFRSHLQRCNTRSHSSASSSGSLLRALNGFFSDLGFELSPPVYLSCFSAAFFHSWYINSSADPLSRHIFSCCGAKCNAKTPNFEDINVWLQQRSVAYFPQEESNSITVGKFDKIIQFSLWHLKMSLPFLFVEIICCRTVIGA